MRYQSPKIEKHGKRRRLRAYVTERQPDGSFRRVRKSITLGTQDETASDIKRRAAGVLGQINAGTLIVERQIKVAELLTMYRQTGLPLVAASTREKYSAHLSEAGRGVAQSSMARYGEATGPMAHPVKGTGRAWQG